LAGTCPLTEARSPVWARSRGSLAASRLPAHAAGRWRHPHFTTPAGDGSEQSTEQHARRDHDTGRDAYCRGDRQDADAEKRKADADGQSIKACRQDTVSRSRSGIGPENCGRTDIPLSNISARPSSRRLGGTEAARKYRSGSGRVLAESLLSDADGREGV